MAFVKYSNMEIFRRVLGMAQPYSRYLAGIFALELVAVPLALLLPIPVKIAVDSVIGSSSLPEIIRWMVPSFFIKSKTSLLLFAAFLQLFVVFLSQLQILLSLVLETYTGERLNLSFRQKLFRHVQRLSFAFHDARGTSDSIYRIQYDAPAIQYIMVNCLMPLVASVLKLLGMVFVIACINDKLALIAISITPFFYVLADQYDKRMRPKYSRIKVMESKLLGIIQEVMTSFRVVKAFGREESEHQRFTESSNETLKRKIRISAAEGAFFLAINMITAAGTAAIIVFGVNFVLKGLVTLGELLMVLTYLTQLYGPLQSFSSQVTNLQNYLASIQRAFELLDEVPDVTEKPHAQSLVRAQGRIEYKDVCFAYDQGHPVLHHLSFSVKPGGIVGIKGKTGAGKSTMVSLLPRFYDVTSGRVSLDGADVRDYKLQDLRNQFAIVLQESVLFSATIAENIMYAKPGTGMEEVIKAAKAANAHDFISRLPEGYETMVGEHGMRLSGGERQRVALARAFLKDAPVLLLDEPTSSVDQKTEGLIMEAMNRLMKGRTTIMIAHRLSTLDQCDVVIEIEDGRISQIKHLPVHMQKSP